MTVVVPDHCDFTIDNLPFGVIVLPNSTNPKCASAIGEYAIDLSLLASKNIFSFDASVFSQPNLNGFMALGRSAWTCCRQTLQTLIKNGDAKLKEALVPLSLVKYVMPVSIGDYTDFYASKEHATNVGTMFRGKENALMPNWVHLPVGYHGRASSVVVSGKGIKRPSGLILNPETKQPYYSPSKKMDFELEVAFIVGVGNELGQAIPVDKAEDHIFGMVIMNDWSARDIQQFEYVPLGPFLGKNFGTTISPWIVTLDALEAFRTKAPVQDPVPVDYLRANPHPKGDTFDVELKVAYKPKNSAEKIISTSNLKYMYWTFKQQLAHHTVNGCNMKTGDLCGSGTISGPTEDSYGSLLELTWNGTKPLQFDNGIQRTFIEDGDEIILRGSCQTTNEQGQVIRLGFGDCAGVLLPFK